MRPTRWPLSRATFSRHSRVRAARTVRATSQPTVVAGPA